MGIFAPVGAWLARRIDARRLLAASLGLIAVFGLVRAVAPDGATILAATVPIAIAMGIAGALLPIIVKERASAKAIHATVVYAFGIPIGSALTPLLAIGVLAAGFGWRAALGLAALLLLGMTAGWLALTRPIRVAPPTGPGWRVVVRRWAAWEIAGAYAILSIMYYGVVAWLPLAYQERGWGLGPAGALLTWITLSGLGATLVTPWLSRSRWGARGAAVGASAAAFVGLVGICTVPELAVPWSVLLGFGIGVVFTITLAVPLAISRDPSEAGQVSSLMLLVGYLFAAASPVGLGAIRDGFGTFSASLWVLVAVTGRLTDLKPRQAPWGHVDSVPGLDPTRVRGPPIRGRHIAGRVAAHHLAARHVVAQVGTRRWLSSAALPASSSQDALSRSVSCAGQRRGSRSPVSTWRTIVAFAAPPTISITWPATDSSRGLSVTRATWGSMCVGAATAMTIGASGSSAGLPGKTESTCPSGPMPSRITSKTGRPSRCGSVVRSSVA